VNEVDSTTSVIINGGKEQESYQTWNQMSCFLFLLSFLDPVVWMAINSVDSLSLSPDFVSFS
jgi:hypothetical protein